MYRNEIKSIEGSSSHVRHVGGGWVPEESINFYVIHWCYCCSCAMVALWIVDLIIFCIYSLACSFALSRLQPTTLPACNMFVRASSPFGCHCFCWTCQCVAVVDVVVVNLLELIKCKSNFESNRMESTRALQYSAGVERCYCTLFCSKRDHKKLAHFLETYTIKKIKFYKQLNFVLISSIFRPHYPLF